MKKHFLRVAFLFLINSTAYGQFLVPPDSSFFRFVNLFHQHYQDDGSEGGIYNHVRRDVLTWWPRLFPHGNMSVANKAMIDYTRAFNAQNGPATNLIGSTTPIDLPPLHPTAGNWEELGPTSPMTSGDGSTGMGQIHRIALHPQYGTIDPNTGQINQKVYAGSHYGGLYYSENGGDLWQNYYTDKGLPMTSVGGVAVSNNKVFVCTGNGDHGYSDFGQDANYSPLQGNINNFNPLHTQGVYAITHGSTQWLEINGSTTMIDGITTHSDLLKVFELGGTMRNIIVNPNNENILLIATSQGIFRTDNGGNTWQQVLVNTPIGNHDTEWRGLEFHPSNPNTVYASGREVYRSLDGGQTWSPLGLFQASTAVFTKIHRINIAVTPFLGAENFVYAYVTGHNGANIGHVYVYDGSNWILQNNTSIGTASSQWTPIAVSPINPQEVWVGGIYLYTSTNVNSSTSGIANFSITSTNVHNDIHETFFSPTGMELFIGTHGGVSKYDKTANTFEELYNGLGVATVWAFDDWEGDKNRIVIGNQDVGTEASLDQGINWRQIEGGDGYGVGIDANSGYTFVRGTNAPIFRGFTYNPLVSALPEEESLLPLDAGGVSPTFVPNIFPNTNHPKDEIFHIGFSNLYSRIHFRPGILDTEDASYEDYYRTHIGTFATASPNGIISAGASVSLLICVAAYSGMFIPPNTCIQRLPLPTNLWQLESNLEQFYTNQFDRRILELAFSEDEDTDYTYLATLGDNLWRRANFYFSDANAPGCSTCFVDRTASLPRDLSSPNSDPNPITGIAVDPRDGNRVWVSLSGYDKKFKVWYSEDAGVNWSTYDDNDKSLEKLNVPINNIVYQRGTEDRLYIATDVGVYVRDAGGNWLRLGDNFPNVRTVELKINYCLGKLRAATFGRGVWEIDLLPPPPNEDYRSFRLVTSNETWSIDKNMTRDIKVKTGATLILDDITLNMPKGGLIVVETGAKLIVNNSTITNLCGETWQGIQVWGNTELAQNATNQGIITVLNGSVIEHARNAISPWEVGNYPIPNCTTNCGGTGGIIQAENSYFKNNWRSADFMQYDSRVFISPTTTIPIAEKSSFKNCTFIVDNDFRFATGFLGHISMWGVRGTQIQGCTFNDTRTNKLSDQSTSGCYGVFTLGASPAIGALALGNTFPPTSFQRGRFEGIERAVDIGNPNAFFRVGIDQCDFVGCEQGVTIRDHDLVRITRNTFQIGDFVSPVSPLYVQEYGVGIIASTNFTVEQNTFTGTTNPANEDLVGSWVDNAGADATQIRNNNYQDLTGGNLAHGVNYDVAATEIGLQFLCNENQDNRYDFVILPNPNTFSFPATIAENQGTSQAPVQPTRNTLTDVSIVQGQIIHIGGQNVVNYHYYDHINVPEERPDGGKITSNIFIQDLTGGANDFCDDNFTDPSQTGGISPAISLNLAQKKQKFYVAADEYSRLLQQYNNLLDKGNSATLQAEIINVLPQHKNRLKDTLMSISPYLTRETVLLLAASGHYNRVKLKEIIMENPNVIIDAEFLDTLASLNTPLNNNDFVDLAASPKDKLKEPKRTFKRTKLESAMGMASQEMFFWANEIIFNYSNDTAGANLDSIKTWIQKKPGLSAQYELVELYWQQGKYQDALNLLQTIPNNYKLGKFELPNHNLFVDFKKLLYKAYQQGRSEATLERQEVVDLNVIASQKAGFASVQAANILQFFYGFKYPYYPVLPNLGTPRSSWIDTTSTEELTITMPTLWGYPNPAINWMDLQYDLSANSDDIPTSNQLVITSTAGQVIQSVELQGNKGVIQLNTTDWAGGIYFAVLFKNKTRGAVYKFVVRK